MGVRYLSSDSHSMSLGLYYSLFSLVGASCERLGKRGRSARRLALLTWGLVFGLSLFAPTGGAAIHQAPIVIPAFKLKQGAQFPLYRYRLFKRGENGEAIAIPFQMDEINKIGDYVMAEGPKTNGDTGNGIFDGMDELCLMGDDVGPVGRPSKWPEDREPQNVFEIRLKPPMHLKDAKEGAVYLAIYQHPPPLTNEQKYVIFNLEAGEILTSRYRYLFDRKNYLVVNGVDMVAPKSGENPENKVPLIDSSTFYAKADLKYFLTVQVNHRSVNSRLESYKSGPIRTLVRVTFFYSFLKLKFEVGMYTEVSFFSNSVILPAIIYNPLDGIKSLNRGSGFYYGFALRENPKTYNFGTNMRPYQDSMASGGLLNLLKKEGRTESEYWASLVGEDRMMYVLMRPSSQMLQDGNVPYYYLTDKSGDELKKRNNDDLRMLVDSPVNLGLYFDLTKFREGEHLMSFQLFFENKKDYKSLETFRTLDRWSLRVSRM